MAYHIRNHNEQPLTPPTLPSSPSPSILTILTQSLQIPGKNTKSKITITLLTLFPFCLLSLCTDLSTAPLIIRVVSQMRGLQTTHHHEFSSTVGEVLRQTCLLIGLEITSLFGFCAAALISISAAARTDATNYNLQEVGLRELVSRLGRASKGYLVTWIYISFITVALVGLILVLVCVLSLTTQELEIVVPVVLGIVIVILGTLGYLYMAVIWVLSLVISVVEEDFGSQRAYNFGSIGRAREANSIKRRLRSSVLILGFSVVTVATALLLRCEVLALSCMCLVKVFLCLGYAVFYYEYMLKYGDQIEEEERLLLGSYAPPSSSWIIVARTPDSTTTSGGGVNSGVPITIASQGDGCEP